MLSLYSKIEVRARLVLTINSKRGKRRKATERIKKSKILKREKTEDDIKDGTVGRCEYSKKPLMIGVIYKKNKIRGEKCKTTEIWSIGRGGSSKKALMGP